MRKTILALNIGALAALAAHRPGPGEKGLCFRGGGCYCPEEGGVHTGHTHLGAGLSSGAIDKLGVDTLSELSQAAPSLNIGGSRTPALQWMGMRGLSTLPATSASTPAWAFISTGFPGSFLPADVPLLGLESDGNATARSSGYPVWQEHRNGARSA